MIQKPPQKKFVYPVNGWKMTIVDFLSKIIVWAGKSEWKITEGGIFFNDEAGLTPGIWEDEVYKTGLI